MRHCRSLLGALRPKELPALRCGPLTVVGVGLLWAWEEKTCREQSRARPLAEGLSVVLLVCAQARPMDFVPRRIAATSFGLGVVRASWVFRTVSL